MLLAGRGRIAKVQTKYCLRAVNTFDYTNKASDLYVINVLALCWYLYFNIYFMQAAYTILTY
jgi:hypothetical protein